jgi:hypothetical protein
MNHGSTNLHEQPIFSKTKMNSREHKQTRCYSSRIRYCKPTLVLVHLVKLAKLRVVGIGQSTVRDCHRQAAPLAQN